MGLSRKFLTALGIEPEKIDEIITAHSETVTGLKDEIAKFKADAEKLPDVQKELDELKQAGNDGWEEKYNDLKQQYDKYKADQDAAALKAKVAEAYKKALKDAGIADKYLAVVQKATDLSGIELDEDGKLKDADKLKESIQADWSEFIAKTEEHGAEEKNPPEGQDGEKSEAAVRARELAKAYHDRQYGKEAQ